MKKVSLFIIIILLGCKQTNKQTKFKKNHNKDYIFSQLQELNINNYLGKEKWIEIKPKGLGYINYKRCDADNRSIQIINKHLIENTGQEKYECKLQNIQKVDSLRYKITIEENCSYTNIFHLNIIDKEKKIIKWDLYHNISFYSTPKSLINNYETIIQPCIECWSQEDCDKMKREENLRKNNQLK